MIDCIVQVKSSTLGGMPRSPNHGRRSPCPINATLEVLGDRWSLLIVRDLMFADRRSYKDLLASDEGIATNILADRLARLEASGILASRRDPEDGRKLVYRLTRKGLDLAPILLEMGVWGTKHEGGVGPRAILRRWKADREGFLAALHARWREQDGERSPEVLAGATIAATPARRRRAARA
jgi:DNA-binding HxlR family transcriptional regulator